MSLNPINITSSTLIANTNNVSIVGNNYIVNLPTTTTTTTTTETVVDSSDIENIEYIVTVQNVSGTNYFFIDGVQSPVLTMKRGSTYTFNQSDSTNINHPIAVKSTSQGSQYTVSTGTPGYSGAQTVYQPAYPSAPSDLRYYCTIHGNGMGNTITMNNPATTTQTIRTTSSSYLDFINSLSNYKGFKIYKPHFHHIHSTYAGNISFIVSSAAGWQDTVIRLWKVSTTTDGSTQYVNIKITNDSEITLASGTDTTKIPSNDIYLKWLVVNDQVNGTQSSFEYPNFSSSFPLSSEQTTYYNYPPVVGENGSAFDFILESGEEYILEYGHSSDSDNGGSYQINIGSLANIESALSVSSSVDSTNAFLGYVDIPSTLGDNKTERAYIFFNLDNSSLSSTGEKGSILLNRIRKNKPVIPEDSTEITPTNNTNTSLSIVQPIRNIPNKFNIDNGGKNFKEGDHIVICNKHSIHENNNIDLFTTYRDGIFTTNKKALYSLIIKVTSVTSNQGIDGIIDTVEIVNFNDIINIEKQTITIPNLSGLSSTSSSYPEQESPYYIFVFDKNYLIDTSSSNLNTECEGAVLTVDNFSTMLFLPDKYVNYEVNYFQNHFVYIPYFNDKYDFFSNTNIIGQNYVYHSSAKDNSNLNVYSSNFLKYSDSISSSNAIPNSNDNAYYRKNISSHKIVELNNNTTDHTSMHKCIPIIFSGIQYLTKFDNIVESSYSQTKPYIIIDSNTKELNNIALSELNIIPFTKDSHNPITFSEKYLVDGNSLKYFKVQLNTFIVPYKFKGIDTINLRYINLHISNEGSDSKQLYGSTNSNGGLLKCTIVEVSESKFIRFECSENPIIQLNIKNNLRIRLYDPENNILEPYDDENHVLIPSNENIQVSITLQFTEIEVHEEITTSSNTEQNYTSTYNKPTTELDTFLPIVQNNNTNIIEEGYISNLENDIKQKQDRPKESIFGNLKHDPKLNKF